MSEKKTIVVNPEYYVKDDDDDYEDYEDEDWGYFDSVDEEILISFLNEYYIVNPDKLPKSEPI